MMKPIPDRQRISARAGFTLIELLVVIGIITLLAAVGWVGLNSAIHSARRGACLANMRSLAAAVSTYSGDNNMSLPFTGNDGDPVWDAALAPYLGNVPTTAANQVLKCPEDSRPLSQGGVFARSYSFNGNLMGLSMLEVPAPAQTVLVAEWYSDAAQANYQYGGSYSYVVYTPGNCPSVPNSAGYHGATSNFVFVDGHAESMNPSLTVSATPSMFQAKR